MKCSKCGAVNSEGFKYCIKCGNNLEVDEVKTVNTDVSGGSAEQSVQPQRSSRTVNGSISSNSPLKYLKYVLGLLLKPFETYKSEEGKLSDVKYSLILTGVVAGAMMIINLLSAMISAVFVKTLDFSTFKYKTEFNISGLKDLNYVSLIVKNLLIYLCIIAAIAVVYYLASLVVKKSINFMKTLSISARSLIPYVIVGMVISPILGKIWAPLSIVTAIASIVYSIILFVLFISDNIHFEKKDLCAYFHLACMTILGTAGYYVCIKLLTSGITNQIGGYLDMLK